MQPRTAVVVDPSSTVRRLVAQVLRTDDWAVIEAVDATDAVESVITLVDAGRPPDLVVMTWVLDGADAPELVRILRRQHGRIPTIVMSSLDDRPALPAGVELLRKPFTPSDLRRLVDEMTQFEGAYQGA